jgi:hypothetical protein
MEATWLRTPSSAPISSVSSPLDGSAGLRRRSRSRQLLPARDGGAARAALIEAGVDRRCEIYPDALHGWTMKDFPVYNEPAAERHWDEMVALLPKPAGSLTRTTSTACSRNPTRATGRWRRTQRRGPCHAVGSSHGTGVSCRLAATSHQVLGAFGLTQEHDLQRVWSWIDEFGSPGGSAEQLKFKNSSEGQSRPVGSDLLRSSILALRGLRLYNNNRLFIRAG